MTSLLSPLFVVFVVFGILLVLYRRELCKAGSRQQQAYWWLAFLVFCGGYLFSTSVGASIVYALVSLPDSEEYKGPDIIVVLAAGYIPGPGECYDVLSGGNALRVARAAEWASENPAAIVVMSGRRPMEGRDDARMAQLMKELAVNRGVSPERVRLEILSRKTREHPSGLLDLEGITSDDRIGIVTARRHLRRSEREFSRYFSNVQIRGSDNSEGLGRWHRRILPHPRALDASTSCIHELIGIVWYEILAFLPDREGSPAADENS